MDVDKVGGILLKLDELSGTEWILPKFNAYSGIAQHFATLLTWKSSIVYHQY
jgi:succinate-acetate transporter protein